MTFRLLIIATLVSFSLSIFSQSSKKLFDAGEKLEKTGEFDLAILEYSKAIELDPVYIKAYTHRAFCYEKTGKKQEAVDDFKKVYDLKPTEKTSCYNAGRVLIDLQNYIEADDMLRKALHIDKSYKEAIEAEIKVTVEVKAFDFGLEVTQMAIDIEKSAEHYFNHALMFDSLNKWNEAEKFYKLSINAKAKNVAAMGNLVFVLQKLRKFDEAMVNCNALLSMDENNVRALSARSSIYASKLDYQNALNDITKAIVIDSDIGDYKKRAKYYETMDQFNNAISDYTTILAKNKNDLETYIDRAYAYEQVQKPKEAIKDYKKVVLFPGVNDDVLANAQAKIFKLGQESNKPVIELTSIIAENNTIKITLEENQFTIIGRVKDASLIKNIDVSFGRVNYVKDSLNPEFKIIIDDVASAEYLNIKATDIYDNTELVHFAFEKIERDKPEIKIEVPVTTLENEINLELDGTNLFIKGKIVDASLIASVTFDGMLASFDNTLLNPEFTINLKIENKETISLAVKDIHGNENLQTYRLNRNGVTATKNNPMGNTWVVFIENSQYYEFSSLEGPAKDVLAMTSALANYKITKIITKKNLSKVEMDKFFSIELREEIKNNNVTSLMIYYAGHGKYVSPTGYWIPVDGKSDDEFSYYGINALRVAMQSYTNKLTHLLVITDACESGATFLMAMRGSNDEEKKCDNKELTRSRSAQVFTSAGFELAADNSYFSRGLVSSLNNNSESCISIDKIVKKVTYTLSKNGGQNPKFGRIKDLDDEGGTWFFIKN
ncbi:caspase family protein [Aurantibacillus circumpalustris]|uniref:caspase family protein n=1 Tax=Aurantibacillus circumpalustris TaxID=3036359 RepID=UPI00295B5780|nr:caspase family protein [Aurantibacillus circumpalustris]